MNYELHELHEFYKEQRFEDLKDSEPTGDKDYIIMNHELHELHEFAARRLSALAAKIREISYNSFN